MPSLTKNLKLFSRNKIQKRIYALAAEGDKEADQIERDLATALDFTHNKLTYYLNNTSQPSIQTFALIAQVLKCSIDDLIELK
jgi:transcriptional regulator with XRE-family HTH domain